MRKLSYLVIALAAACGDDGNNKLADAPHTDGPGADTPIDTAPDKVTVTVTEGGAPRAGVHVYFTNADQSPAATQDTDASGNASATVTAGGYVTAIDPFLSAAAGGSVQYNLVTIAGVKPGDHLLYSDDSSPVEPQAETVTVTVPYRANAQSYEIDSPCGGGTLAPIVSGSGSGSTGPVSGTVTMYGCPATTQVLVVALDGESQPVASFLEANVAIADGGTLDFSADTYTDAVTPTYTFTNVDGFGVGIQRMLTTAAGSLASYSGSSPVTSGTASIQLAQPSVPSGAIGVLNGYYTSATSFTQDGFIIWDNSNSDKTIDTGAIELAGFTSAPVFDTATNAVSWGYDANGQPALASLVELSAGRASANTSWQWTLYSPYTAGTATFPTLPTDIFAFNPTADDQDTFYQVGLVNLDGITYDQVRAHVADQAFVIYNLLATGQGETAYYLDQSTRRQPSARRGFAFLPPVNPRVATHRTVR